MVLLSFFNMPKESIREQWRRISATLPFSEVMNEPSMCEPSSTISLEQMVRDYSRGILHSSRVGYYDNGEEVEDPTEPEDISEVFEYEQKLRSRKRTPAKVPDQVPPADPAPEKSMEDPAE